MLFIHQQIIGHIPRYSHNLEKLWSVFRCCRTIVSRARHDLCRKHSAVADLYAPAQWVFSLPIFAYEFLTYDYCRRAVGFVFGAKAAALENRDAGGIEVISTYKIFHRIMQHLRILSP